jgi:soluble lytic murein transglycosylase-like protein
VRGRFAALAILLTALCACGHKNGLVPSVPSTETVDDYTRIIEAQATINHVPAALIGAIIAVESGGNAHATGKSGSLGLMQVKPATAAQYGITDLFDPAANIAAGAHYLHDLFARFRGNLTLAIAAYNAGPGAVSAAHGVPPNVTGYVERVMAAYNAIVESGLSR